MMVNGAATSRRATVASYVSRLASGDFGRAVVETFGTRVVSLGCLAASSVITARALGPEGRGLCAVAAAVGAIGVQLTHLGMHASNTFHVAKNRALLPSLVGNALLASFGLGTLTAAGSTVVFDLWPSLAPVHGPLLLLGLAWIPFGLAYLLLQNLLLGIGEVRTYNAIELASKVLALGLVVLVVVTGFAEPVPVFASGLIALAVSVGWSLQRLWGCLERRPWPSATLLRNTMGYGLKMYAGHVFAFLLFRVDLVLVQYLLGPAQAGYYSLATNVGDMLYVLPMVVGSLLFPRLAAVDDAASKWAATKKVAALAAVLMVATCGVTAAAAKPVVAVVFGAAFVPAVPALLLLLPGVACLGVSSVLSSYVASIDIPGSLVVAYFAAFVLNVGLNLVLLQRYGIAAASVNSTAAYALIHLYLWVLVRGRLRPEAVAARAATVPRA